MRRKRAAFGTGLTLAVHPRCWMTGPSRRHQLLLSLTECVKMLTGHAFEQFHARTSAPGWTRSRWRGGSSRSSQPRNTKATKCFFRKLLKGLCYAPGVIVTDKLGSCGVAKREILPGVEHRQSRYLHNRCEVPHQAARWRERPMRRFKSARHAQQFLAIHTRIHNHFQLRRHRLSAGEYRVARDRAFDSWRDATGAALA